MPQIGVGRTTVAASYSVSNSAAASYCERATSAMAFGTFEMHHCILEGPW
jgi:hypothetical protein